LDFLRNLPFYYPTLLIVPVFLVFNHFNFHCNTWIWIIFRILRVLCMIWLMVWIVRMTLGLNFAMVVCRLLTSALPLSFFSFGILFLKLTLLGKYFRSRKLLKMKLPRKRESVPDWYVTVFFFPSRVFVLSQWMLMYALMYLRSLRWSYLCGRKFYFHHCAVIVIMQFDY
jgi:hypothetical protein